MYNNSILYCWGRVYVWRKEGQRDVEAERKKGWKEGVKGWEKGKREGRKKRREREFA